MDSTAEDRLTDSDFSVDGSVFPNEFVNPWVKERSQYGLKYAKAMFYASNRFGGSRFWTDTEFLSLMDVAQGRQSIANLRSMFGYFDKNKNTAADDGSTSLSYLDIQVLNLAPKYINRAVEKIMNLEYEVQLECIDPISVHEKATYEAALKTFYEFKSWITEIKLNPRDLFPDLDVDVLPEYPDELMFEMLTNPKIDKAIDGENALALIHQINDFNQKMRMVANDKVVIGRGHLHIYRDENGIPRVDRVNPRYYLGSYVEDENFDGQENAGLLDFPTVNQFRKEARETLSEEQIEEICKKYAYQNNMQNSYYPNRDSQNYDGLNYIPVMRFYFLSNDERVYIKRPNKNGNMTLMSRSNGWKPKGDDPRFGPDGDSEVVQNEYTSVYGGTWVLDSDVVYNYGRKNTPRSNLVDTKLPIVTFAPNYKDGRTVSFTAQMIEPLLMINVAWNKIKEILAKGWMGVQEIDFTQLETIALGKGGQDWKPRDVYMHFLQTGRLIKRSPVNKYDQRYSNSAVDSNPTGLQLADYFTAFTTGINMLEQMTGQTIAESVQIPDRTAVEVMKQSQATGDLDMGYLFNSHRRMFQVASHLLLLNVQEAKRDGVGIDGFVVALGRHFSVPDRIAYCDFGLFLTPAPGPQQWAEFYAELAIGLEKGSITHLDSALIREVKNLKKARQILGIRVKINERKMAQMTQAANQAAMDANRVAASDKTNGRLAEIELKANKDRELTILKGKIDEFLIIKTKELEAQIADRGDQVKKQISKQASVDDIIKQVTRNQVEKLKVEKRPDKSPGD